MITLNVHSYISSESESGAEEDETADENEGSGEAEDTEIEKVNPPIIDLLSVT